MDLGSQDFSFSTIDWDDMRGDGTERREPEEPQWSSQEQQQLLDFVRKNPTISKRDNRSRSTREKLWRTIQKELGDKFSVEQMQLKLLDLQRKWRSEDIDTVISFYRDHPLLWDQSLVQYRDRSGKNIALEKLARKIQYRKASAEIIATFDALKTTFRDKIKKRHTGEEGKAGKPWPYFQALMFLKDTPQQTSSFSNANDGGSGDSSDDSETSDVQGNLASSATQRNKDQQSAAGLEEESPSQKSRPHRKRPTGNTEKDDELKNKLMKCLDTKQDGCDDFGFNIAETLRKFSDTNREFVKAQIQQLLAVCLRHQDRQEDMPIANYI